MILNLDEVVQYIQDQIEEDSQNTTITKWVNKAVDLCALRYRWPILRRERIVTPTATGIIKTPPLAQTINGIYKDEPEPKTVRFRFREGDQSTGEARLNQFFYKTAEATLTGGADIPDMSVTQGSQAVVDNSASGPFLAADVGKLIVFDNSSQNYEIVAFTDVDTITVFPVYDEATTLTEVARIEPLGEQQWQLFHPDRTVYSETDIIIDYQMFHPRLAVRRDRILIPCSHSIMIATLREANRNLKFDNDALALDRDFEAALTIESGSKNREPQVSLPRGLNDSAGMFAHQSRNVTRTRRARRPL